MQKQEERIVQGKETILRYTLVRKKVKNLNMRIYPEGKICVSANFYVPVSHIDAFVLSHQKSIAEILEKYEKIRENMPKPMQYVTGEKISYLGEALCLQVESGKTESAEKRGNYFILRVKDIHDFSQKEKLISKWLKERQREVFDEICREIYVKFQPYGIPYPQIKIRTMKSRWGSCQPYKGIITLNAKMIAAPKEAIEYVVLHEFAHFIHQNHSKEFYSFVEKMMPDWKERKALLEKIF